VGLLRINPGHPGNGVYSAGARPNLTIRAFPKGNDRYELVWRVEHFAYPEAIAKGSETVQFGSAAFKDVSVAPTLPAEVTGYRLIVEATPDNGKALDQQEYLFGNRSEPIQPYRNRTGTRISREQIKRSAYNRLTYLPRKDGKLIDFQKRREHVDHFLAALEEMAQVTTSVTIGVDYREIEILPGVFNFYLLDKIMDAATDQNCRLSLRLAHADAIAGKFIWQRYWPQRSYDGSIAPYHGFYGSFSPADKDFRGMYLRAMKAINDRYKDHPAFQGYQIFELCGEWAVIDKPFEGAIATYEKCARADFIDYLKEKVTSNLDQLNTRWGTAFKSWKEVNVPQPLLKTGPKPDLRPQWMDFCRFKYSLCNGHWYREVVKSIRSYDQDCVLMVYRQDPGGIDDWKSLEGIDYFHGAGNHELEGEGMFVDAWEKHGIGWITEPHMPHRWASYGDPDGKGWLLDWTTYIMLAQAGAGGANMHIYHWPIPGSGDLFLPSHYGREYAFDRWEKWFPLLREMHGLELLQSPPQVAVLQDVTTLFAKHRTSFTPRLFDLRRWFELLRDDAVTYEEFMPKNKDKYKLIVPNIIDQVMSRENISAIADSVRKGGHTVIMARTGSLCPDTPEAKFVLLKELGIKPPQSTYKTTEESISARGVAGNHLFAENQEIPFFSVADMKRELRSESMRKRFWSWQYRWLPQTDYFGYYPGVKDTGGEEIATFADGSTAVSLHKHGKGKVLVFWGCPDYSSPKLKGFMQNVAKWAGVDLSRQNSPVPLTMEGKHKAMNRHYAIMWQSTPGTYKQPLPLVPEGKFFIDDLVSGQRLGVHASEDLHKGVPLTWVPGLSPLKILRMIPYKSMSARWVDKYQD
jgi:hypothetical protein